MIKRVNDRTIFSVPYYNPISNPLAQQTYVQRPYNAGNWFYIYKAFYMV